MKRSIPKGRMKREPLKQVSVASGNQKTPKIHSVKKKMSEKRGKELKKSRGLRLKVKVNRTSIPNDKKKTNKTMKTTQRVAKWDYKTKFQNATTRIEKLKRQIKEDEEMQKKQEEELRKLKEDNIQIKNENAQLIEDGKQLRFDIEQMKTEFDEKERNFESKLRVKNSEIFMHRQMEEQANAELEKTKLEKTEIEGHYKGVTEKYEQLKNDFRELEFDLKKTENNYINKLTNMKQSHDTEIAKEKQNNAMLKKNHEIEISTLKSLGEQRTREHENKITNLKAIQEQELRNVKNLNEQELRNIKGNYDARIENLTMSSRDREKEMNDVFSKNRDNLQNQNFKLSTNVQFLNNQVAQKDKVIYEQNMQVEELKEQIKELERLRHIDEDERKQLHNKIMELKGNIRVFCRVRPLLKSEPEKAIKHMKFLNNEKEFVMCENKQVDYKGDMKNGKSYNFEFDRIFGPADEQDMVFSEISQLVQSALDGYKVCIFAYGQTGSGKTYTMEGKENCDLRKSQFRGMIPRSVEKIFDTIEKMKEKGWKFKVRASFMEIYMEKLRDLLIKKSNGGSNNGNLYNNTGLEIKHDKQNNTVVKNLTYIDVPNSTKVYELLKIAHKNRKTAKTSCNVNSSRSHSIFTLDIYSKNNDTTQEKRGTLHLIDLAGSERLSKSKSSGKRLEETKSINKSLSCLANVMSSLEEKSKSKKKVHVPFRDSKLTYLLQNSLGGQSKCLMFCNVSPLYMNFGESINSLRFASKVNSFEIGVAKRQLVK